MKIRPLEFSDLQQLIDFTPPNWSGSIFDTYLFHFGKPYFHPFAAEVDGRVVGCEFGLINGNSGWLNGVVVLPHYGGQGVGTKLFQFGTHYLSSMGCATLSAFPASQKSISIVSKLGYTTRCIYTLLKRERSAADRLLTQVLLKFGSNFYDVMPSFLRKQVFWNPTSQIRPILPDDHSNLLAIDREITGEFRETFLNQYLSSGWVFQPDPSSQVTGFILEGFGFNPVMALDQEAGLELLRFKLGRGSQNICVPSENQVAIDFLLKNGFNIRETQPRMTLGPELNWHSQGIFNRGSGTG